LSDKQTLPPLSITDRQVSGQAKIKHSKLAQVNDAQILIGGANKKLSAQEITGDATLQNDGTLLLDDSVFESKVKSILDALGIEAGASKNMTQAEIKSIYQKVSGVNQFNNEYKDLIDSSTPDANSNSLARRDSDGALSITVDKLEPGKITTTPAGTGSDQSGDNKLTFDKQPKPITEIIANYDPDGATGSGEFEVEHGLGYVPTVTVFSDDDCGNYDEIDMYIENTDTKTKIKWNSINTKIRTLIK